MRFTTYILLVLIIFGCSSNENQTMQELEISVINFETSYNQVKMDWKIIRPAGVIIEDLLIYRVEKNDESEFYQEKKIANLPSTETTFVDDDVPYKREVTYIIKINYKDERENAPIIFGELQSEPKKFVRAIVKLDRVPFQVQKDPLQDDVFHILDKEGTGSLKKYNSTQNQFSSVKTFSDGSLLNNKFHIVNDNEIYLADTKGKIYRIKTENYETTATYQTKITDNLNSFSVSGKRIYYQDEDSWCFYDSSTNVSTKTGYSMTSDYSEYLGQDKFLLLFCQNGNNSADIYSYTPENCPGFMSCSPIKYFFLRNPIKPNSYDANIFSWNKTKSKFISSINGCIFNINNLNQEIRLFDITGKHYFQFSFDENDNIYATVQGEKIIHKFNSKYELVEVIKTKLYPFFPMVSKTGLKVIGGYEPISYWSFEYGYSFNFNTKCAIEILEK